MVLEAISQRSTYEEAEGPGDFKPVARAHADSWAKDEDTKMPAEFESRNAVPPTPSKRPRPTNERLGEEGFVEKLTRHPIHKAMVEA